MTAADIPARLARHVGGLRLSWCSHRSPPGFVASAGTAALSLAFGLLAGSNLEAFLFLAGTAVVGAVCLVGPRCRLVVCVLGALAVFQSELTSLKYAYLAVVVMCFALSVRSVLDEDGRIQYRYRPLVLAAVVFAVYLGFTVLVARSNGTSVGSWLRDVLSYVLLIALPFVGIAAGPQISERWNQWWLTGLGLLCSVGLAVDWLERRGVSALPFGRLLLSSAVVVGLCFAYAITVAGKPGTSLLLRTVWASMAGAIMVAMVLSGSRTNLVLLVVIIGLVGARSKGRVPPLQALVLIAALALALVAITPIAAGVFIKDPTFLSTRVEGAARVLEGQAGDDQSFKTRALSYDWVAHEFDTHPMLGTGPGHLYQLPDQPTTRTSSLDAPAIVVAKFGLLGSSVLIGYLVAVFATVRRMRASVPRTTISVAVRGWVLFLLVLTPFGPWLEDKGLGLALALIFAGLIGESSAKTAVTSSRTSEPSLRKGRVEPLRLQGALGVGTRASRVD